MAPWGRARAGKGGQGLSSCRRRRSAGGSRAVRRAGDLGEAARQARPAGKRGGSNLKNQLGGEDLAVNSPQGVRLDGFVAEESCLGGSISTLVALGVAFLKVRHGVVDRDVGFDLGDLSDVLAPRSDPGRAHDTGIHASRAGLHTCGEVGVANDVEAIAKDSSAGGGKVGSGGVSKVLGSLRRLWEVRPHRGDYSEDFGAIGVAHDDSEARSGEVFDGMHFTSTVNVK